MSTMKALTAVGLVLLIFGGCSFACLWPIWPDRTIATFDLGDGFTLRIWRHDDWFDLDQLFPSHYYSVFQGSKEVVPKWWIGVDRGQHFGFRLVFADGETLACVYSDEESLLVFDHRTHESWPRHMHYDKNSRPIPMGRWAERFKKLADENPGLPRLRELARWQQCPSRA